MLLPEVILSPACLPIATLVPPEVLANKASNQGIDLRTHKGYVVWYPEGDIRDSIKEIKESSPELNTWLEELFGFKK